MLILTYCTRGLGKTGILISQKKGTLTCFFLKPRRIEITCINVDLHREEKEILLISLKNKELHLHLPVIFAIIMTNMCLIPE